VAGDVVCLMLYVGSAAGLTEQRTPDLSIEPLEAAQASVRQWFRQPVVQFVGAHTGCSCGFPSVVADTVIEYYDGMWVDSEDRSDDLRSIAALLQALRSTLGPGGVLELYPVWAGGEVAAPKGIVEWSLDHLVPETFFFNEQFMHVVRGGDGAA